MVTGAGHAHTSILLSQRVYVTRDLSWLIQFLSPLTPKLNHYNFHALEVVSRYRDPQLQVRENYSHMISLWPDMCTYWSLNAHFVPNNSDWSANKMKGLTL